MVAKAQNGSAVALMAETIRERIRQGTLSPGHRLVESDLTEEFGVSRGSVREVLNRLSAEGLVTVEAYRGAMVRRMSTTDLEHLYQVREALEGLAARLAASRIDQGSTRKLMAAELKRMERAHPAQDPIAYMDDNTRFHGLVVELGGNPLIADTVQTLGTQIYRYTMRNLLDEQSRVRSCAQHIAVAQAILSGDATKAERLMRQHVRASGDEVIRIAESMK